MSDETNQEPLEVMVPQVPSATTASSRQPLPVDGKMYYVTNRSGLTLEIPIVVFNDAQTVSTKTSIFVQAGGTPKLPPKSRVDWAFLKRNPVVTEHEVDAA